MRFHKQVSILVGAICVFMTPVLSASAAHLTTANDTYELTVQYIVKSGTFAV